MRIMFMSTRRLGEKVLEGLMENGKEVIGVGASPVPAGVTDRLRQTANRYNLPFLEIKKVRSPEFYDEYVQFKPEINVMALLPVILPESVLFYPKLKTIGWHPSLLPKYAGTDSLNWPIIFGETKTANTVFWADKGIDSGDILLMEEVEIAPHDTLETLYYNKIVPGAVETIVKAVDLVERGKAPRIPQDLTKYSYYSRMTEKDTIINWVQPAAKTYNLIRGTNPYPGATTYCGDITFKVLDTELHMGFKKSFLDKITTAAVRAGEVIAITDRGIEVVVPDGVFLIKQVLFNDSKTKAADFAKQLGLKVGDKLGTG